MESEEVESSTPPGSAMSSVVVADGRREKKSMETARLRYPEKVKELDLESLECRRELAETLGIERVSHEDLNRHHCVDWLKAHEAHFSRAKLMETTDLTGIPTKAIMGPINYRPLKLLGSPGLIVEPPKHRTGIARIRLATPAQLKVVDKLLNPGGMELPDAAYEGPKLAEDPRYGKPCGGTQLAKTLAVYDRADPAAARVVIVAGSDFEGTSPKLFWPETLVYSLPGAELNQMLTLVVAIKSEMPCEPELLLFAGMNDHLHAMGLLEQLKGKEIPTSRKIWEAIQALFAAMNEVQENVASRFGSKTKVVFTTSPGYANMPPALQFVYAVLILIAEGSEWRILMAAPNRELEPSNLERRMEEGKQRDASVDGPVPGDEVGPNGDNPGSRGGGDLHLWSSSDVRVSRSPGDNVSSLGDALESHQRTGWYSAELVSAGGAQGAYEQHGTLRKSERCRNDGVQLQGTNAM